jgi:hypothetical protein
VTAALDFPERKGEQECAVRPEGKYWLTAIAAVVVAVTAGGYWAARQGQSNAQQSASPILAFRVATPSPTSSGGSRLESPTASPSSTALQTRAQNGASVLTIAYDPGRQMVWYVSASSPRSRYCQPVMSPFLPRRTCANRLKGIRAFSLRQCPRSHIWRPFDTPPRACCVNDLSRLTHAIRRSVNEARWPSPPGFHQGKTSPCQVPVRSSRGPAPWRRSSTEGCALSRRAKVHFSRPHDDLSVTLTRVRRLGSHYGVIV